MILKQITQKIIYDPDILIYHTLTEKLDGSVLAGKSITTFFSN